MKSAVIVTLMTFAVAALPAQAETVVFSSRVDFDAYLAAKGVQAATETFDNLPVIQLGMMLRSDNTYPTPFNEQGLSIGVLGGLTPVEGKNEISDGRVNTYFKDSRDFLVMLVSRNIIGFDYTAQHMGPMFVESDVLGGKSIGRANASGFVGIYSTSAIGRVSLRGGTGSSYTIDNVTFDATVPEPITWAMMVTGFGLLGAVTRKRSITHGYASA